MGVSVADLFQFTRRKVQGTSLDLNVHQMAFVRSVLLERLPSSSKWASPQAFLVEDDARELLQRPRVCGLSSCSKEASSRCSRCCREFYCSRKHQREAWKGHKKQCQPADRMLLTDLLRGNDCLVVPPAACTAVCKALRGYKGSETAATQLVKSFADVCQRASKAHGLVVS